LGGVRGVAESAIPGVAFVTVYTLNGQELESAAIAAVVVGVALSAARVLRGETVQYALSGLVGVAIAAFIATRTGNAEDFFLPGILFNLGYAAAYLVSIAVRWPLIGVFLGAVSGEGTKWREDPHELRAYTRASWPWVFLFSARVAVQLPLYFAGAVVALGTVKVAMGVPLFVLGVWVSFLILRREGVLGSDAEAGQ